MWRLSAQRAASCCRQRYFESQHAEIQAEGESQPAFGAVVDESAWGAVLVLLWPEVSREARVWFFGQALRRAR